MNQKNDIFFREIIRKSSDMIVVLNEDGLQTYASDAVEKHLDYKPHELTNIPVIEQMVHPEDQGAVTAALKKIAVEGQGSVQYRHRHKTGSWIHLEAWGTNQLDNPAIKGIIMNVRSIAEWKKAELKLKKSEDNYRHLIENANEGILVIQNEKIQLINPKGLEFLEYSLEELSSGPFTGFIHEDDRETVLERYRRRIKGESFPDVYPFRVVTKSSKIRWVELKVALFQWEDKPATLCFLTDITDQQRAEEALEKRILTLTQSFEPSEDIVFEDLFDIDDIQRLQDEFSSATGVASIITKPDGTPITRASNFCRLCNDIIRKTDKGLNNCFKSDAVIGRYNPEGPIVQTCLSGGLWDAGSAISVGNRHIANWLIGQVRDETQSEEGMLAYAREIGADENDFIAAFRDVPSMSEKRFSDVAQALFTFANQLSTTAYQNVQQERFISELKRADKKQKQLQIQLNHAQKMESVGRLAGGVAHDFNNMLGIILGNAEMILEDVESQSPIRRKINEIYKAAERSAELTKQLLAFARKQTIEPQVLNLNDIINGMLNMLKADRLIGEHIELEWIPNTNLQQIKIDPSQIDQILANLCVNSRDSIESNGRIVIKTDNVSVDEQSCLENSDCRPGEYVQISFSDNGCGMDEKTLENIFEPFFTTKGVGVGTGLGLATIYGIVQQNGGFLDVSSEPDTGTVFTIHFPVTETKDVADQSIDASPKPGKGSETILIVEDEEAVLEMIEMMLVSKGYTVITASKPSQAIQLVKDAKIRKIHLLLTDVVMPEMNGSELVKEILKIHPDLKCLFMSGYTADVIAQHGVIDQGLQFLGKPFTMHDLTGKVRQVLDES